MTRKKNGQFGQGKYSIEDKSCVVYMPLLLLTQLVSVYRLTDFLCLIDRSVTSDRDHVGPEGNLSAPRKFRSLKRNFIFTHQLIHHFCKIEFQISTPHANCNFLLLFKKWRHLFVYLFVYTFGWILAFGFFPDSNCWEKSGRTNRKKPVSPKWVDLLY